LPSKTTPKEPQRTCAFGHDHPKPGNVTGYCIPCMDAMVASMHRSWESLKGQTVKSVLHGEPIR
jgi:hypothetical protein